MMRRVIMEGRGKAAIRHPSLASYTKRPFQTSEIFPLELPPQPWEHLGNLLKMWDPWDFWVGPILKVFPILSIHFFQASFNLYFHHHQKKAKENFAGEGEGEGVHHMGAITIAMATTSMSLTSTSCFLPSPNTPSRQVWHQSTGRVITGKQRRGEYLIRANLESSDASETADGSSVSRTRISISRRQLASLPAASFSAYLISMIADSASATASEFADMPALRGKDYGKTKMNYPDYVQTQSGLQYKDLRTGSGPAPNVGNTVVVDWDGYTIGYYGRIFEARNKPKGGSFEGDEKNFFRFKLGNAEVIPAFEEAVATMKVGGVRRIIVPPELGYPNNDYNRKGPKPTTFSGQRALDFVLRNQGLIDKTLLFDIELLKVAEN